VTVCGLRVVQPVRLFVDMARRLDLVELVVLGDAILNRGLATREALAESIRGCAGSRGIARARAALAHLEPHAESPMETRLRMRLVLGGLPRPVAGRDAIVDGGWLSRPDLQYPKYQLAMEYDGDTHRMDRRQWRDDIFRKEVLEDHGWRCLVFTADDVLRRPTLTTDRVLRALISRGWRS
jgi:very-short-patch-repair endonuclease